MDAFFESPKHTTTATTTSTTSAPTNPQTQIKTEYAQYGDIKLVTVITTPSTTTPTPAPPGTDLDDLDTHSSIIDSVLNMTESGGGAAALTDLSPPGSPTDLHLSLSTSNLNSSQVSTHTFRKTEWDVKKLENYVRIAYADSTPMELMSPQLLNRYLKSFFELAKKSDGMDYEPESLIGFMNSFERYLKTKNYSESLLRSETFKEARTVLKKKRDLVRSIGKLIRTKTKDTSYLLKFHHNILKDKGLLSRENPDHLLAEIYLNNMIYFGEFLKEDKAWRGNLNLVWGDMLLERDPQTNVEYLTLATYSKRTSRNQQYQSGVVKVGARIRTGTQASKLKAIGTASPANGNEIIHAPRVYAEPRQPFLCPIEAYKIYRSRRPNNCLDRDSPFYLAPLFKSKNQSKVWYKALAMSCQRLDALFYCLFKKAGVDLNSLANMSQQQQQQAAAAAAGNSAQTATIGTMNGGAGWGIKGDEMCAEAVGVNGGQQGVYQVQQIHVPAQVQVQVQIQVVARMSQQNQNQQQQSVVDGEAGAGQTAQRHLFMLSPTSGVVSQVPNANSYAIIDA